MACFPCRVEAPPAGRRRTIFWTLAIPVPVHVFFWGALAGHPIRAMVTGDASLRRRPMARVNEPLRRMGATIQAHEGDRLPLCIEGSLDLVPIEHRSPVASAQIKSALLLAGVQTRGRTTVIEPARSRDHTENMLARMGANIRRAELDDGYAVSVEGDVELAAFELDVPGDPSSAAFPIAAALLAPGSHLRLAHVGVNPLRTGLLTTLGEMGASIEWSNRQDQGGEPVADLEIRSQALKAVEVPPERAPSMIDEFPILAVLAARAEGTTVMRGVGELRVKESDRIDTMEQGLRALGVQVESTEDDWFVTGLGKRPIAGGVTIDAEMDHRIAMSFLVMGTSTEQGIEIDGAETVATSFPGFASLMKAIGADMTELE